MVGGSSEGNEGSQGICPADNPAAAWIPDVRIDHSDIPLLQGIATMKPKQEKTPDPISIDRESALKWIQSKQKQIERAQADYEMKKEIAKEAKEHLEGMISELLSFISDLNNGQGRINFDETQEEEP